MTKLPSFWTDEVRKAAEVAKDFHELSLVGIDILSGTSEKFIFVCGPVSTGGLGSVERNLQVLNTRVHEFIENGEFVFDQTPFEDVIKRLREELKDLDGTRTLEEFYRPIIESGYIKEMRFLPGWKSSIGATWERNLGKKLGITIVDLE